MLEVGKIRTAGTSCSKVCNYETVCYIWVGRRKYLMNLPHYSYFTNDFRAYEFISEGPKGKIKKVVTFSRIQDEPLIYNITLVDVDPVSGLTSDLTISDNGDREIILATVAHTVIDFSAHYGNHFVFAKGSTTVRTRLYQIAIAALLEEIGEDFDMYGVIEDIAYPFQKNVNYEAFLVKKK